MNREIKYRAWDDGKMIYEKDINHLSLADNDILRLAKFFCNIRNDSKIMQYTGLKDKNGKEIYEGDIVSFDKRMYEVCINFNGYYLQRYKLWNGKFKPSFQYGMSLITKPAKERVGGVVDRAEVIGNRYETPELVLTD
jgi:uncharacterized phage protein (TIGR01671 family)